MKLKWNLGLVLCLAVISSCGEKKQEDEQLQGVQNVNAYDFKTPMNDEELLTEDEFDIAKNICSSFQNMRAFVSSQSSGLNLDFRVEKKLCGNSSTSEHQEGAKLNYSRSLGVSMTANSRSSSLATDVLSDQHQRLSGICSSVLAGNRPSNTITDGVLKYQVNFYSVNNFEWIQIAEFKKNDEGIYYPYLIEKAGIVTSYSSSRTETHGFTKYRAVHRPCPNKTSTYTLQEWL